MAPAPPPTTPRLSRRAALALAAGGRAATRRPGFLGAPCSLRPPMPPTAGRRLVRPPARPPVAFRVCSGKKAAPISRPLAATTSRTRAGPPHIPRIRCDASSAPVSRRCPPSRAGGPLAGEGRANNSFPARARLPSVARRGAYHDARRRPTSDNRPSSVLARHGQVGIEHHHLRQRWLRLKSPEGPPARTARSKNQFTDLLIRPPVAPVRPQSTVVVVSVRAAAQEEVATPPQNGAMVRRGGWPPPACMPRVGLKPPTLYNNMVAVAATCPTDLGEEPALPAPLPCAQPFPHSPLRRPSRALPRPGRRRFLPISGPVVSRAPAPRLAKGADQQRGPNCGQRPGEA